MRNRTIPQSPSVTAPLCKGSCNALCVTEGLFLSLFYKPYPLLELLGIDHAYVDSHDIPLAVDKHRHRDRLHAVSVRRAVSLVV